MNYRVLIVDDELLIREGLRRHIDWDTLGMEVLGVADSAEHALIIAEQTPPDILITDICMRGKDGFDLIEDLMELGVAPQVILISSYNDFSYAQRAVRLEVVREYILKPVDTDKLSTLLLKMRQTLDQQHHPALLQNVPDTTIPVDQYRNFLCAVRLHGYDRHQLVQYIKGGNASQAEQIWDAVAQTAMECSTSLPILIRFCVSLLMTFISDGILMGQDAESIDPVGMLSHFTNKKDLTDHMCHTILQECNALQSRNHNAQSKLIATCLQIIDREYCNPNFNLTTLAAELNVTPNYLSVRFKEETGFGFMKCLLERQIEKAKLLLGDPLYKVYQISDMVGFQDEKYFSRQFKKIVGVTPKDYRNNHTSPV